MIDEQQADAIEPEVLPPEDKAAAEQAATSGTAKRLERAFGPIVAGVLLDVLDFATFGPLGLIIGAGLGYWICTIYRFPLKFKILGAFLAGWYCMIPFTRFIPLATLVGAYARFRG